MVGLEIHTGIELVGVVLAELVGVVLAELVGVVSFAERREEDESLCSSVIPREASMLIPSRVISPLVLILISGSESLSAILSSNFVVVCHIPQIRLFKVVLYKV